MDSRQRLRLRLPTGAELEVEGTAEFVTAERREFLALQRPERPAGPAPEPFPEPLEPDWSVVIETQGSQIQLRAKPPEGSEREACLILLAAAKSLLKAPKPTAARLARWLRASGYPIGRVDRALQESIANGDILSSGSRRARRYELSAPGLAKGLRLSRELARRIQSPS